MRIVSLSLAIVGLCSLMFSGVVAYAVLAPVSHAKAQSGSEKSIVQVQLPAWTTTVTRE